MKQTKQLLEWLMVFLLLSFITVYTLFGISNARLLPSVSALSNIPIRNFYMEDGQEIDLEMMRYLLFNTNFDLTLINFSFSAIVGEFELSREEEAYLLYVIDNENKTYKKCLVLRFLRDHPEILARFPELEDMDDNIPMWRIDGINCLNTQGGGIATALGIQGGGVS